MGVLLICAGSACTDFADGDYKLPRAASPSSVEVVDAAWDCVVAGGATAPLVEIDPDRPATYSIIWIDLVTRRPPAGLVARACALADVTCASPLAEGVTPDASGLLSVPLYEGFAGYLEVTSDSTVPTLGVLPVVLTGDYVESEPGVLVDPGALAMLVDYVGNPSDESRGYLGLRAQNCLGDNAGGVSFELGRPDGAVPYYFANGLPNTQLAATTSDGLGGFLNVPSGAALLSVKRAETGQLIRTMSLLIRRGWQTTATIVPDL